MLVSRGKKVFCKHVEIDKFSLTQGNEDSTVYTNQSPRTCGRNNFNFNNLGKQRTNFVIEKIKCKIYLKKGILKYEKACDISDVSKV